MAKLSKRPRVLTPTRRVAALAAALACAFGAARASAQYTGGAAAVTPAALSPGEEDTDEDGIPDNEDACKRIKGVASETPRLNGCPPPPPPVDSDGDGVADGDDACPKKKGVAASDPKLNGCPPPAPPKDSDGDGIPDLEDACPKRKGVASDAPKQNGCPVRVAKAQLASASAATTVSASVTATAGAPAELTFAGFRSFDDGSSLVFVELTGPVTVDVKKVRGGLEYTLENTQAPLRNNRNPLLTGDFSSIVRRATIAQRKHAVVVTVALKADVSPEHHLLQRGGATVLEIQLPKAPATATTTKPANDAPKAP